VVSAADPTRWVHSYSTTGEHQWLGWYAGSWMDFAKPSKEAIVSEYGAQALPGLPSLRKIFLESELWPRTERDWGKWDFHNFQRHETFELGVIDPTYTALTRDLYRAQERRWESTRELTAASEDSLDRAPWFVYFNIYYQGQSWQCRDHSGQRASGACGFSAKAAFGWAALLPGDYSRLLEDSARTLGSADGYVAGRYPDGQKNTALNINTNAVILEAMLYRQRARHAFLETNP
jgi:hypothetical protein